MKRRYFFLLFFLILGNNFSLAQDFSNKGKEFYLCFPQHVPSGSSLPNLSIFITSDKASSGTITMANGAFSSTFNIAANGIQEIKILFSDPNFNNIYISNLESNTVIKKSIRIKVDSGKPAVVAYAQQWAGFRSAATLLLPVSVLGRKYYTISFNQNGSNAGSYLARSQFQIIAVKDNTVVTITPRKNGVVGAPFTVTLPLAGDIYQYQSIDGNAQTQDLTGTLIESVASGSGGCLPIAVFSGSSNITFGTPSCNGSSYDPLWQQNYPVTTWGKNFGLVPFADYPNGNPYRVLASEDNTEVFFNGSLVATLNAGEIYPAAFTSNPMVTTIPINISSTKPVCVALYAQADVCSGQGGPMTSRVGDPDMVILNPIEQNISDIIIFSSNLQAITKQWINVVMKTNGISSFRINGTAPFTAWQPFPNLPGYSYLRHLLPGIGSYRMQSDSGFNAIAYGWGNVESYAYSAGTSVRDLYNQIGTVTPYGGANSPSVCKDLPTRFKISVPYQLDSMYWDFHGAQSPNIMINGPTVPIPFDSINIINGQQVYWYSLAAPYTFTTPGTFPVTVTTYSQNASGCGAEQDIDFEIEVYNKPVADFTFTTNGCASSPVNFLDNSTLNGRTAISWSWNFGDGNTSVLINPTHTYAGQGTYSVKHTVLSDIGCLSDTVTKVVTLSTPPAADFSAPGPYCAGSPVAFNDNSTASGGTVTNWLWNFGDPASGTNNTSTLQNPSHSYTTPGIYTVTLIVTSNSGCQSFPKTFQITVLPIITPTFTSVAPICSGASLSPLPATSNNGITGTWTPALNNTSTTTYTFTPTAGQCALTATLIITVNPNITPTFQTVAPICSGASLSPLPTTSLNGFTGTWSPALNNTATTTYTFTPAAGQCATTATLTIIVNPNLTPLFTQVDPICSGGTLSPLPTTSNNGISGTWAPALNNTATTTYTFTPNAGQCGTTTTMTIAVSSNITPTFNNLAAICSGSSLTPLPPTSNNGFTGTWSPVLNNTSTTTYTFTPNAGQCATTATLTLTVNPNIIPTFNSVPAFCSGAPAISLPTTSLNGITGSWSPALNNTTTTTYTFTPTPGLCALTTTLAVTVNPLPTASISGTTEVCFNSTPPFITFTGSGGTAPYTFNYTIDPGTGPGPVQSITTIGNSVTIPVLTTVAGVYTYRLVSVTEGSPSACNQPQTGSATITVNPLPTPDFSFSAPSCVTRAISFSDLSVANAGSINTWQWNFDDPLSGASNTSTLQNPTHIFLIPGIYNVRLSVSTNKGCVSPLAAKIVVINELPKVGFISPQICLTDSNAPFIDTSTVPGGSIVAWNWNFGDPGSGSNNTSTLQNPTHSYSAVGSYTATLTATSNNGCRDSVTQTFIVNGAVPVSSFTVQNSNMLCSNRDVSITDGSTVDFGNIIRVEVFWDYTNDPTIKTTDLSPAVGKIYTHTYPEFGTPFTKNIEIRLVAYSGINCVSTFFRNVSLLATPTVQFEPIDSICSNIPSFQITQAQILNGLPGLGIYSGPGISPEGIFNPSQAGTGLHRLRYTYTGNNGCVNSQTQTIEVNPTPIANAGPDKFLLEGGVVTLTPVLIPGYPVSYSWTPVTGLSNPDTATPAASPPDDITYTLTVTSDEGCQTSDEVFVKVLKSVEIPNVFSPNGDGINDKWVIKYLESYPGSTVEVFNRYGLQIYFSLEYKKSWDGTYKGQPVPAGTYYYIVDPKNGRKKLAGFVDILR